jgi:FkbM family methyltransferase
MIDMTKGNINQFFIKLLFKRIKEGMIVFDIGAHIGIFSLGAAKRVGITGKVYCFEPSPETIEILKQHISFNEWQNRMEIIAAVVSNNSDVESFYTHGTSMASSLGRENV